MMTGNRVLSAAAWLAITTAAPLRSPLRMQWRTAAKTNTEGNRR